MKLISLNNLRLAPKLTLLLSIIFIISVTVSGLFVTFVVQNSAKQEISTKGSMLMSTMNSVRDYTTNQIQPLLNERSEQVFLPETVPAFSAHTIFNTLKKNPEYREFLYRETVLNPTNIADRDDAFERQVIERFRTTPDLKEQTGFRSNTSNAQGQVFYMAHPTKIVKQTCLRCHGNSQDAPQSMIAKYGNKNGFNWKLNDIVGMQIISVPADHIFNNARYLFFSIMGMILAIFGIVIGFVNFWLRRQVVEPVTKIAQIVEDISMGKTNVTLDSHRRDEIGMLAQSIDRLNVSLKMAMRRISSPVR